MSTARVQVSFTPEQRDRLEQEAASRGVTVPDLIRSAVAAALRPEGSAAGPGSETTTVRDSHWPKARKAAAYLIAAILVPIGLSLVHEDEAVSLHRARRFFPAYFSTVADPGRLEEAWNEMLTDSFRDYHEDVHGGYATFEQTWRSTKMTVADVIPSNRPNGFLVDLVTERGNTMTVDYTLSCDRYVKLHPLKNCKEEHLKINDGVSTAASTG